MAKWLVELTPGVLVGPELLVGLGGYLQPLRYVEDSDKVLQFYHEVVPWWHVLPLTPPGLRLPGLIGLLFHGGLLFYRCLMHPYGLRSTWCTRACGNHTRALLVNFPFCCNMSHHATPYLFEGLRVVSNKWFTEGAWHNALPERVHHHPFVFEVQPHYLCPKAVEELLQRLSLILSYVKEIIRDRWGSPIRDVLRPEQLCKLWERRHMAIREADEPVHRCSYQGAHEQLASHRIGAPN